MAQAQARGGQARVLQLDLVERDRLDEAASFVVDLLERPGSDIHVLEGQLGLDEALVVPGHPDAFELSPVASIDPGIVWAVDGGSCTVADGRSFQVAAFRAARVRFAGGETVAVERPQLDVRAVAPEEMARLARVTLTELCGAEPERLPELPRPVDALREWAEWGEVGRTVRDAGPGGLVRCTAVRWCHRRLCTGSTRRPSPAGCRLLAWSRRRPCTGGGTRRWSPC